MPLCLKIVFVSITWDSWSGARKLFSDTLRFKRVNILGVKFNKFFMITKKPTIIQILGTRIAFSAPH